MISNSSVYNSIPFLSSNFFRLTAEDLTGENVVELRFVKFQNVSNLHIFIKDNMSGSETTEIDSLTIYGMPVSTTNMQEFKRVAGEKGESH